jgi:hypothetical protein
MPVITEKARYAGDFLMSEGPNHYSREAIIIASGAGKVVPGTILGKITASGKYVPSPATGADGSQTGVAIALYDVDATSADAKVAAIVRLAEVNKNSLVYEATVNDTTKKAAKLAQLVTAGIIPR